MATERTVTVLELTTDNAKFLKGVKEADDARTKLSAGFKLTALDLQAVTKAADGFLGGGGTTLKRAEEYAAAVEKIGGASKLTAAEQGQVNAVVTEALAKYKALGQEAPPHLVALQKATAQVDQQTKTLTDRLKDLGSKSLAAGTTLSAAVTAPLAGIATLSVKAAMDFESAFAGVRKTVTGTPAELDAINTQFREMAKVTPVSAVGLAKIGEMAGQLGVQKEHITEFAKTIVDISVATNLTAEEAGTSFAKLANVMKLPQDQFSNLGSAVVALGNFGASTEQEMLDMAQRISAAGATAGFTTPQVLGIANALSSVGIEAEAGGTAISRVIVKMSMDVASGGGHLQTFAKVAGMSAQEFSVAWRDNAGGAFSKFMQGLADARKHGGDELLGLIHELGFDANVRLANAFLSAANAGDLLTNSMNVGSEAFTSNTELARAAGERYKTTANQLKILEGNINDVAIELGNALIPVLNDAIKAAIPFVHTLEHAVQWFEGLPEPVKVTVLAIAGIAAAIGPALLAFGGMARGVTSLVELYGLLVPAAAGAEAALAGGAVATGTAAGALALLLNPITLTIGALGLLAGAIYVASTQQSELEQSLHSSVDAFKATTTQLDTLLGTYQSLKDKQNLTKEETEKLETATRELAKSSGLSVDAFKREESQSDQLTSALREQLKARKELLTAAIDEARGKWFEAFNKLEDAKETLTHALKGELLSSAGPESAGAPLSTKERIQEVERLNVVIAGLTKEADAAKLAYQGLAGATAKDISIPPSAGAAAAEATKQTADYVKQLADARVHLANLSAEQRVNLTAAVALHTEYKNLAPGLVQSAAEYDLFKESLSKSTSELKKSAAEAKKNQTALDDVAAATEYMSQATYDAIKAKLESATVGGKLVVSETEIAKTLGVTVVAVKRVEDAEKERATGAEKYAKVMEASQAEIDSLLSDAEARELKASGDITQAKIVDVGKWMLAKVAALNKEISQIDPEYWRRIAAIAKDGQAKVNEITADAGKKHQEELDKLEAEDQKTADATAALWEKYNGIIERSTGDRVESQIRAIRSGAAKELAAIQANLAKETAEVRKNTVIGVVEQDAAIEKKKAAAKKASDAIVAISDAEAAEVIQNHKRELESLNFSKAISGFEELSRVGGSAFGPMISGAGQTMSAFQALNKVVHDFELPKAQGGGFNIGNIAAIAGSYASIVGAFYQVTSALLASSMAADRLKIHLEDAAAYGKDFAATFSDALVEAIKATSAVIANNPIDLHAAFEGLDASVPTRFAAEALHLTDVIREMGGISKDSLGKVELQMGILFRLAQAGGVTSKQAIQEINGSLQAMGEYFAKNGGLWDQFFKDAIAKAKELGLNIAAIADLTKAQQDKLVGGAVGVTAAIGTNAQAYQDLTKAIKDAQDKGDNDTAAAKQKELAKVVVTTQGEFDRLSRIELAALNTLVASGLGSVAAMGQVGTGIDNLIKNADAFSLSGNAAFDELKRWRELTTANAPLLAQIGNLNDLMVASANLGSLTADGFRDLEAQGASAFKQLTAAGLTQQEAETAMKPLLESIIKLHKDKGLAIDDETQKLIDQATQDGVLGAQQASTQDVLREGLGEIITLLGGDLPKAWQEMADKAKEAADKIAGKDGLGKVKDGLSGSDGLDKYLDDGSEEWKIWKKNAIDAQDAVARKADDTAGKIEKAFSELDIKPIPVEFQYRTTGDRPDFSSGGDNSGGDHSDTPAFAGGTRGKFLDFGAGTLVTLHGRERVMTPAEVAKPWPGGPSYTTSAGLPSYPSMAGLADVQPYDFGPVARALSKATGDLPEMKAIQAAGIHTSTTIVELDGKVLTRATTRRTPGEVKRLQMGRR